jgi:hypothetical protein
MLSRYRRCHCSADLGASIAESIEFEEDVEVEHEEEHELEDTGADAVAPSAESPPASSAPPAESTPEPVAPSPSGSNLEYTEDFEAMPSMSHLSATSPPPEPETTSPEATPDAERVKPVRRAGSVGSDKFFRFSNPVLPAFHSVN